MRKAFIIIAAILELGLFSCANKGTKATQESPDNVMTIAQSMYNDVMSMYYSGDNAQENAFGKYASTKLQNLLDEVSDAISKEEIEPMIYGWDCDPWIVAQDWIHPTAKVAQVKALADDSFTVDVVISDDEMNSEATNVTITLVKENDQWKVDDFASPESGIDTFAKKLKDDFESAKTIKINE